MELAKNTYKSNSILVIVFCDFQREISHTYSSLLGNGLDHIKYNMCCQITLCYWWQLRSLRLIMCWPEWINSSHTNTWNLKFSVATPLWAKCEGEAHTPKSGNLESSETPENSELKLKGQNTLHLDVLSVIEKVLKCRCLNWPRIGHLNICSPSYGQKKGRESNWQFDSRPLKVGNRPPPDVRWQCATWRWKALEESYNFGSNLVPIQAQGKKLWMPKVPGVQTGIVLGLHLGSPGKKSHLDVASARSCREYYKGEGGGFPRVRVVVSQVSPNARGLSQHPRVFPNVN
jgi:hypothetical protein